ncbi:MAG: hypothetical protein J4F41_10110 [Alphaproteobacteria bacterium]|nr:hypothetical protein [Alphaproteobacteria bacterium]
MRFNQICLGIITLSFLAVAMVQTGVVKPAHALNVNAAVRILGEKILASEDRIKAEITKEIRDVCAADA